ncbi:unnamed protein product [Oppiella nova]|uniref:3-hydroxyisobutyrate dehydrogenase, mitochondrial n=1 Tax=Oppiella nova TaxID=334625 RepID=A0A7R9M7K0_9ACAR|nr:unnamed protein product [Oppiella nova]CAG2172233.1 unnamed protein product [Oppiella nova]
MGSNMAQHLMNKGHQLVVYDVFPEAMTALADKGALIAQSPADLAQRCDRIISMLPTCSHVRQVYCGDNGVLSGVKTGTLLIDSSTIDPNTSQEVCRASQAKGAVFLDAPVSGAVPAARAATLTFMVGGNAAEVEAIKELLLCMGKNVIHCGAVGSGAAAKICNNMMLAIGMVGTSETLNLAKRLGLDPKLMTQILNVSSGRSWTSEVYNPVPGIGENLPAGNDYKGGFMTQLIAKDLGLAQSAATRVNAPTPLGTLSHQLYRLMKNNGYATKDFSSVYKFIQELEDKK